MALTSREMEMESALNICNDRGASLPRLKGSTASEQTKRRLSEVFSRISAVNKDLPPVEQLRIRVQRADCEISFARNGVPLKVAYPEALERALRGRPGLVEKYLDSTPVAVDYRESTKFNVSQLTAKICGSYAKIFAILIKMRQASRIISFLEAGIEDSYLPLAHNGNGSIRESVVSRSYYYAGKMVTIDGMDQDDWESFYTKQNAYLVPYFGFMNDGDIVHYRFESGDIIPVVDTAKMPSADLQSETKNITALGGGYSVVTKIKLAPMCDGFGDFRFRHKEGWYAVKTLSEKSQWRDLIAEVYFWKLWHSKEGLELEMSPLLCTWEQKGDRENVEYCLLFPCASGDLRNLWTKDPAKFKESWLIFQCWRLAETLSVIHQDKDRKQQDNSDPEDLVGRHGDIKPENILWFANHTGCDELGTLVLADFGISKTHRALTKSRSNNWMTRHSLTYRAPEYDLVGQTIGRKADIWALACTWLEFATWFLTSKPNTEFSEARELTDPAEPAFSEDCFFVTNEARNSSEVKKEVLDWVKDLELLKNCTGFFHEFLQYIMSEMLVCQEGERATATAVASRLKAFLKNYAPEYYAKKHKR